MLIGNTVPQDWDPLIGWSADAPLLPLAFEHNTIKANVPELVKATLTNIVAVWWSLRDMASSIDAMVNEIEAKELKRPAILSQGQAGRALGLPHPFTVPGVAQDLGPIKATVAALLVQLNYSGGTSLPPFSPLSTSN